MGIKTTLLNDKAILLNSKMALMLICVTHDNLGNLLLKTLCKWQRKQQKKKESKKLAMQK